MYGPLYPLTFAPLYKGYIWGGTRLDDRFHRGTGMARCAESWEVADRPDGASVVANGRWRGETLGALGSRLDARLLGSAHPAPPCPLLVKILDAASHLSVQVHPNDETARRTGGEAKTEMWIVLDAAPGAAVFAGLRPGTGPAELAAALDEGAVEEQLQRIPVEAGTAIIAPGGLVHSIGPGCLLLEIQQNSDTTYRIYDWNRVGPDGRPRDLHIDRAMQVIDWTARPVVRPLADQELETVGLATPVGDSPYFAVDRLAITGPTTFANDGRSFHVLFVADGSVDVAGGGDRERLSAGRTALLPAGLSEYKLQAVSATAQVYRIVAGGRPES